MRSINRSSPPSGMDGTICAGTTYFFRKLARHVTEGRQDEVRALYEAVRARVDGNEPAGGPPVAHWPYYTWQSGHGLCDRQAWVLCELAWQLGYECEVVYLTDPETGKSPHTICEIRRAPDRVWLADPYLGFLLPNVTAEMLADNADLMEQVWPDKPELHKAMQHCVRLTPAYPQSYCPRDQRLARRLCDALGDRAPRFGEDPVERLQRYEALMQAGPGPAPRFPITLWQYPWRILLLDMAVRSGRVQGAERPGSRE